MHVDAQGNDIRYGFRLITGAGSEPLTTDEAKTYLRAGEGEDAFIDAIVAAARRRVEKDTGRPGIDQTFELALDGAPGRRAPIYLPVAPVSAYSIKAYDPDNAETIVSTDSYRLDAHSMPPRLVLNDGYDWPTNLRERQGLIVTITAGYGAEYEDIEDAEWMQAVRLLIGHWYENRSAVEVGSVATPVAMAYDALIAGLVVPFGRSA